jgi:uncharacterized membrane protein YdjX (TVP38/TMEM64 family)
MMNDHPQKPMPSPATPARGFSVRKFLVMVAVIIGAMAALHYSPLQAYLQDIQHLKHHVQEAGPWASVAFTLAAAVLVALGIPRLLVCGIAGMLFGFCLGMTVAQAGTLIAAYSTFVFVRWTGLHWAAQQLARHRLIRVLVHAHSPLSVFLARQFPIHGMIMSMLLGSTTVSHRDFLIGSFLGFLPQGIVATLIGSGIGKDNPALSRIQLGLALVCVIASGFMAYSIYRRLRLDEYSARSA